MPKLAPLFAALFLAACATTAPPSGPHVMVATANPHATEAGLKVLKAGGSAVDAAVAIQAVLALVEPQSSSVAGGAYMVFYDARTKTVTAYDGREMAPAGATPDMFLDETGKSLPFFTAVLSGRSTGVPGAIAMLALAQREHGKLPWSSLFADGERLADEGFVVSPRLSGMINSEAPQAAAPDAVRYFTKADGTRYRAGDVLKNPAYAATLHELAAEGPSAILAGETGQKIVARLHEPPIPGAMTMDDLARYSPKEADALCAPFRIYVVCTDRPPSSGVALLQALMMLDHTDIATRGPKDPVAWVELAEAERLMYADRDRYVGDPGFVKVPVEALLDPAYVASRAALIGQHAGSAPQPGALPASAFGPDNTMEPGGTSHVVVVDNDGNVLSMTTTVENIFGSGRMVDGFFLNNQLTDFSFSPVEKTGLPAANAVAPGKRPRSSMSPVIVLDRQGNFVAALGSPGGSAILAYNLKTLVALFDWGLPMQQAIDLPNLTAKGDTFVGEPDRFGPELVQALAQRGIVMKDTGLEVSGIQGVIVRPTGLEGGADSRREGVTAGY
jgi:gamma-glutamyltranspeptidase/glutathione hydrolase